MTRPFKRKRARHMAFLSLVLGLAVVALAALQARSAPGLTAVAGQVPIEVVESDGLVKNGPLVEVTEQNASATGWQNIGQWLNFNATRGRWRVLLFVQMDAAQPGPVAQNEVSNGITALGQALAYVPNTEFWIVRMDNALSPALGIPRQPVMFGGGCGIPMRPCFNRYICAAAVPGKDNLYYWPQAEWFMHTFPTLYKVAAYRGYTTQGRQAYPAIQLPYWAIVSPNNVIYGQRSAPDEAHQWQSNGHEANMVLVALNSLMVQAGDHPILEYPTHQGASVWGYVEAGMHRLVVPTPRGPCVHSIYDIPGANQC